MAIRSVIAGIAVTDIEAARSWYGRFLGQQPDRIPMPNDMEWDFGATTLQIFDDGERAGKSSVTLEPDDFENEVRRLADLGHKPSETGAGSFRFAIFHDPEGNQLVIAKKA